MNKLKTSNAGLLVALVAAVIVGAQLSLWFLLAIDAIDSILGIWPSVCSIASGAFAMILGTLVAWSRTNAKETTNDPDQD